MNGSRAMVKAFSLASTENTLDRVQWIDNGRHMTANLKKAEINPLDTTDGKLIYELYDEIQFVGQFEVNIHLDIILKYESFLEITLDKHPLLTAALFYKKIKIVQGQYVGSHTYGLVGEEDAVEKYIQGVLNNAL